jgi:hypothetical protein
MPWRLLVSITQGLRERSMCSRRTDRIVPVQVWADEPVMPRPYHRRAQVFLSISLFLSSFLSLSPLFLIYVEIVFAIQHTIATFVRPSDGWCIGDWSVLAVALPHWLADHRKIL